MKKAKKKNTLFLALVTVICCLCVGSYAWMVTEQTAHNETKSLTTEIKIVEKFASPDDWAPEEAIVKEVSVRNSGETTAFVRLSMKEILLQYQIDPSTGNLKTNVWAGETVISRDSPTIYWQPGNLVPARYLDDRQDYQLLYDNNDPPSQLYYEIQEVYSGNVLFSGGRNAHIEPYIDFTWGSVGLTEFDSAMNRFHWIYEDGYFYYTSLLEPGQQTTALITEVFTTEKFPNLYKGGQYRLEITEDGIVPSPGDSAAAMLKNGWQMDPSGNAYAVLSGQWDTGA